MTRTEKLIKKLHQLEKTWDGSDAAISDAIALIENAVPSIDLLQSRLERGERLAKQDGRWCLFDSDGEGLVSGKDLRGLLTNLIFMDC